MAQSFKVNSNFTVKKFSSNYADLKPKTVRPVGNQDKLQTQYDNLQYTLQSAGQTYDNRNWAEKLLGINADTKEHAGILSGTMDIITRPLDVIKASVYDLEQGKGGQDVMQDVIQGITQGKGKNLTGTQILGLGNAHLDTFTKFIVNVGVDIGLDPLTYVPAGAIFKGLKKVGTNFAKLPGISNVLTHAKASELGMATKNLWTTTKNQFGKLFSWMYGSSDESKMLFSRIEADKASTVHEFYGMINKMLDIETNTADDLFNYAKTGQLPGSKVFKNIFKDEKKAKIELDKTVQLLGLENPETLFKDWAKENFNGNIAEAKKNLISFITDSNIKSFQDDWTAYQSSGAMLKPDGFVKNDLEAAESFWLKKTKEWEQLTPNEVKRRWQEGIYNDFLIANPSERTLNTIVKGLNNGKFPLPTNDPEALRTFLTWFSKTTGLDDPLLNAKYIRTEVKGVRDIDKTALKDANQMVDIAKTKLRSYKGTKQKQIIKLQSDLKLAQKNLSTAQKGKAVMKDIDISRGIPENVAKELGLKSILPSSYFDVSSMRDYGKTAAKDLDRMLAKMKLSPDEAVRLEYAKMMEGNELNTVRAWLQDAEGKGVMIHPKKSWNPKNITFLDDDKNIITPSESYKALSSRKAGDSVVERINDEVSKGLKLHLKGQMTDEILSTGILGVINKEWKTFDGLTDKNVFEVADKLTRELLDLKVELPAFKLTPFNGYLSKEYVQDLTIFNSEMYRMLNRFDLDPTILQKSNVLRNITNPDLAKQMRLINLQKNLDTTEFLLSTQKAYTGLDPAKVLNSKWLMNAQEVNHTLGFKLLSTNPLESMRATLQVYPESLSVAAIMKSSLKSGDIRVLTDSEKVSFEVKSIVPNGKKLVDPKEIINKLEGIKDLVPKNQYEEYVKTVESFKDERNVLISIGLNDQLSNISKVGKEAPGLVNYLNKFITMWKKVILVTPGYHARNMFGNLSQTVSAGIPMREMTPELNQAFQDVSHIHKITNKINTQLKSTNEILNTEEAFVNFTKGFLTPYEHNLYHDYTELMRHGITGQAKVNSDYWEVLNKIGKTSRKNSVFRKGWDTVFNANMKLSQTIDDGVRLAAYRVALKNPKYATNLGLMGKTSEELAQSFVRYTFFDYNALTSFEKNTMRKIFPFYTWSRKNLEYQVRTLINTPEKFGRLLKIYNDWEQAEGYDTTETPDYIKENMWLPVVKGDNVKFIKIGMPQQDLSEIFGGNGEVLSRLNPFYKLVLESITGQNVFTKQTTTPAKSIQAMFWQPIQKLLVQPFDIPVGALPIGDGRTFGEVFGHPNDYTQKTSLWYEQNIQTLHQSYLWQQIKRLTEMRQQLRSVGVQIQTKRELLDQMKKNNFSLKPKLTQYRQFKVNFKDFKK